MLKDRLGRILEIIHEAPYRGHSFQLTLMT